MDKQAARPTNPLGNLRITPITIALGIIALCAFACFASQLFSFGGDNDDGSNDTRVEGEQDLPEDQDGGGSDFDQPESENEGQNTNPNEGVNLGEVTTATGLDRDGCAVEAADTFDSGDEIYVVTEGSEIPTGTSIFVRLYKGNKAIEDAAEIIANEDYENVCISFVFEPVGEDFEAGEYEAEFYINGNPSETVRFEIQ